MNVVTLFACCMTVGFHTDSKLTVKCQVYVKCMNRVMHLTVKCQVYVKCINNNNNNNDFISIALFHVKHAQLR